MNFDETLMRQHQSTDKCEYLGCQNQAVSPPYCGLHTRKFNEIRYNFLQRGRSATLLTDLECIYVIGSDYFEPVKIGRASDPLSRLRSLQIGNPFKLKLLAAYFMAKHESAYLEWRCHHILKGMGFGVSGEWFDLDVDDAHAVIDKCAMKEGIIVRTPHQVLSSRADYELCADFSESGLSRFYDRVNQIMQSINLSG